MSAGFKMKLFQAFIQTLVWLTLCSRASAYVGHGVKGVFAHYMVGSMADPSRAVDDVRQAHAMGIDAFALNVQVPDAPWALSALEKLFSAAASTNLGFKLFFSLDMAARGNPVDFVPLLQQYLRHASYYRHDSRPLLSTFHGASGRPNPTWQQFLDQVRSSTNTSPFFLPNFEDWSSFGGPYTPEFFSQLPCVNGVLGWETAWPLPGSSSSSQTHDEANLAAAHAAGRVYALPISPYQFKHIDQHQNWFRPGGLGLIHGLRRALALQPDFVELLTWNDAGEGHWFGNIWPEGITAQSAQLIQGFNHAGWRKVLGLFIAAIKAGAAGDESGVVPPQGSQVAGAFWYRPLARNAQCWRDGHGLEKPRGWEDAEDMVNVAVALAGNVKPGSVMIKVWSGEALVATLTGRPGMNVHQVAAAYGRQKVQVVTFPGGQVLAEGAGSMEVTGDIGRLGGLCNFNYQVVEVA